MKGLPALVRIACITRHLALHKPGSAIVMMKQMSPQFSELDPLSPDRYRMVVRRLVVTSIVMVLGGCAAPGPVKPFEGSEQVATISEEESRLWVQARDVDAMIRRSGQIYRDEVLQQYVQQVMDQLYPEFRGTIRVRVIDSPTLNAFALPNGSIYFNLGLLARADNEAQLATVLAHEGAHFVNKHSLQQRRAIKSRTAFAMGTAIVGVPLADLIAISSIYGFSRDLEREADGVGYERLRKTGYDVRESVKVFEHLDAEVKALDLKQPVFFSSHPKLKERIDSFNSLIEVSGQPQGRVGRDVYMQHMRDVRLTSLQTDLSMNRYKSVILVLENEVSVERYEPYHRHYYLGEAYRLRDEEGDAERAEVAYKKAIEARDDFAPSYRALGLLYLKKKETEKSRPLLEKYLRLAPNAPDRAYIEHYLNKL